MPLCRRPLLLLPLCLLASCCVTCAFGGTTTRASVSSAGAAGLGDSTRPSISADGRYVAFTSAASTLVSGDNNGCSDIFLRDRQTGTTTRVSVSSAGAEANGSSDCPAISADGRRVAFYSAATNLVADDTNDNGDIFVRDLAGGVTTRVSVGPTGQQANDLSCYPSLSSDGQVIAFISWATNLTADDGNGYQDVFVRDTLLETTERLSVSSSELEGDGPSWVCGPRCVSGDGRYIAFYSLATNLVADDSNNWPDVFVRDRTAGSTVRVSVSSGGGQASGASGPDEGPTISANGRYVVFSSDAANLVAGDDNYVRDVFVHDCVSGVTSLVSIATSGAQGNGISGDGVTSAISNDGRYVAFASAASNLVSGDTNGCRDIFVRDLTAGQTRRVSTNSAGVQSGGVSGHLQLGISNDGARVAFASDATDLVAGDGNNSRDIFVRDEAPAVPTVVTWSPRGTGIGRRAPIIMTFSVPMQHGSVENNFVLLPARSGTFTWTGRRMTFTPALPWLAAKRYRVTLNAAARSSTGIRLGKTFTWSFETLAAAPALTVSAAAVGGGAQFTVSLAATAQVAVTVRNAAGREVARLRPGELAAGVHTFLWNGRTGGGVQAPPGVYVAEVEGTGGDGIAARAVARLVIRARRGEP